MLRFHWDEHVSHAIAHGLRRRGIDVTTTTDAGLLNATDEQHISFANQQQRVIFTNDADFLRLAASGLTHAGIVFCSPEASDVGAVIRYLSLMNDCLSPEDIQNQIEFI